MDEVIWNSINHHFCSYKVETKTHNFCRNEYNLTGLCTRQSCPLANSRYATVKLSSTGIIYLYIKTPERAHTPAKLWERIKLSKNYQSALQKIDSELQYWPEFVKHKCKQRLTKLTQTLIRMRRIKLRQKTKLVSVNKKLEKREERREKKAEIAARLDNVIENELLERLKKGVYGTEKDETIINDSQAAFLNALDQIQQEQEYEYDEDDLEEEEEDLLDREFVSDPSDISDQEDIEDNFNDSQDNESQSESESDSEIAQKPKKKQRKTPYIEIEYENEQEEKQMQLM